VERVGDDLRLHRHVFAGATLVHQFVPALHPLLRLFEEAVFLAGQQRQQRLENGLCIPHEIGNRTAFCGLDETVKEHALDPDMVVEVLHVHGAAQSSKHAGACWARSAKIGGYCVPNRALRLR